MKETEIREAWRKCDYCNTAKKNSQMTTGIRGGVRTIRNICKFCESARKREYYNRTAEKQKQKSINRVASGKSAECSRRMNAKHPEKISARKKAQEAVLSGKLIKEPCRDCSAEKVEGHHPDYSKPLEVIWLCKTHHSFIHRKQPINA